MSWAGYAPSGAFWTINIGGGIARTDWEFPNGDVTGPIDNLLVIGLQGQSVSTAIPVFGDVLTFDGSQWAPSASGAGASGIGPHNLLSSVHLDTVVASPVVGDIIVASGAGPSWLRFPIGIPGQFLGISSGNFLQWKKPSNEIEIFTSGTIINLDSDNNRVIVKTGGPTTVNLPSVPLFGQELIIKDGDGSANTNNITIAPSSGVTIDGVSTVLLAQNYQAYCLLWNGTEWNII